MSSRVHEKNNNPTTLEDSSRQEAGLQYPSHDELIRQIAQLGNSLDGAYETLDSISTSEDPEIYRKVSDMVEVLNGLHECEYELMDLLVKDSHNSPGPSRVSDNPADKNEDKANDNPASSSNYASGDTELHPHGASQEDLSLYGAYAVSSSRPLRNNELAKFDKPSIADLLDPAPAPPLTEIPRQHRVDFIRRLEEIQKGLVLGQGFALDKNFISKFKEVKDIMATKELAQQKILELKALIQEVTEERLDGEISLSKIENDESSYARPFRLETRGASSLSPPEASVKRPADNEPGAAGSNPGLGNNNNNVLQKPQGLLVGASSAETSNCIGPTTEYADYIRVLRQPLTRDLGERESAFVPIHNLSQLNGNREKNKSSVKESGPSEMEVKMPRIATNPSLLRRTVDGGNQNLYSQNISHVDHIHPRYGRSNSARASLVPPPTASNTMPSNLFRSNYSKSPPSMQSSGVGSMSSRTLASLDNARGELPPPYFSSNMSRVASRGNQDAEENVIQRSFPERSNVSSNNLNKSYRQPSRSSSFYSEYDFRNQEVFPQWEDDPLHTSPMRPRSPDFRRRMLSSFESQQITDELNRVLRCRNEDTPLSQQNWWSSSTELGQADRHPYVSEHPNFMHRTTTCKPLFNERSVADCYSQIMQLHIGIQEVTQQIRNLNMAVSANKTATRDSLLQHRFDLHNVTRCIRDVSDMVSDSMKRVEGQVSNQTRLIMDMETRLRRVEDNQRSSNQKFESSNGAATSANNREREWQLPGRPDFMVSQDNPFQYSGRDSISRERDNGQSGSMLNNQIPPGTRANNYWDNFRSYSRQNMLSKSNANVPQQFSHEASPSAAEASRHIASEPLNNSQSAATAGTSDAAADSRRNGAGKNLWATSGFYENMSTKKRNKDQKSSQSSTLTSRKSSGYGNISVENNSAADTPIFSRSSAGSRSGAGAAGGSQDAYPELDLSFQSNRQYLLSELSPIQTSPTLPPRRESALDSGPFSRLDFVEVPFITKYSQAPVPSSVTQERKRKEDGTADWGLTIYEVNGSTNTNITEIPRHSTPSLRGDSLSRHDDNSNANSQQLSTPKVEKEKHLQNFESRPSETTRAGSTEPHDVDGSRGLDSIRMRYGRSERFGLSSAYHFEPRQFSDERNSSPVEYSPTLMRLRELTSPSNTSENTSLTDIHNTTASSSVAGNATITSTTTTDASNNEEPRYSRSSVLTREILGSSPISNIRGSPNISSTVAVPMNIQCEESALSLDEDSRVRRSSGGALRPSGGCVRMRDNNI